MLLLITSQDVCVPPESFDLIPVPVTGVVCCSSHIKHRDVDTARLTTAGQSTLPAVSGSHTTAAAGAAVSTGRHCPSPLQLLVDKEMRQIPCTAWAHSLDESDLFKSPANI